MADPKNVNLFRDKKGLQALKRIWRWGGRPLTVAKVGYPPIAVCWKPLCIFSSILKIKLTALILHHFSHVIMLKISILLWINWLEILHTYSEIHVFQKNIDWCNWPLSWKNEKEWKFDNEISRRNLDKLLASSLPSWVQCFNHKFIIPVKKSVYCYIINIIRTKTKIFLHR